MDDWKSSVCAIGLVTKMLIWTNGEKEDRCQVRLVTNWVISKSAITRRHRDQPYGWSVTKFVGNQVRNWYTEDGSVTTSCHDFFLVRLIALSCDTAAGMSAKKETAHN